LYRIGVLTSGQKMVEESKNKEKEEKKKKRKKKRLRLKEEKESSEEVGGKIDLGSEEDYLSKGINLYAIGSEGIALYVLGEYDEAFYHFDKAIKLNPNDYYFYYWRGRIYFEKRLYDQAIQDFDKAIRLKSNVHSYYWRGRAYFEKCLYDKAIEDFTKCIKLHPKNSEFYYMRGQAYFKRKLYREAVRDFNKAIKLNPNYDEALKAKKEVEKLLKSEEGSRTKEEKKEIKKLEERVSAESNPNNTDFYYHRGRAYFERGLYNEAIECFTKAIELKPDEAYFYGWRGIAYYEKGDYDKAIECFTEAIELEPDEADFYYWRGRSYYEKKRYDEAIEDFTEAIRLEPNEAGFYWWRGRAYYEKADYGKAIEDFTKAIKLKPDDAYIYWWRGRARYRKGEHNESIQDFTEAIKLKPDDADFYGWRGGAYYEKGKYDEAIHDLTKAIELKPDMAGFYYLRGNAYYWKGEYEKAIKDFDKVLELNPSYKEAREAKKEVENLIEYKKKSLVKSGNGSSYEEARKAKKEVESSIESKKKSLIKSENGRKAFKVSVLLMLFLTSVPMLVILDKKDDWQQRFIETIKENQEKIRISQLPDNLSSLDEVIDYVIYQLPDHKIKGAALPRDTNDHFIIAYVSWLSWMIFLIIVFSSSSNGESRAILSSILSSLFTAILGILILLVIQWLALEIYKSGIWEALKMSRGRYFISNLILYFIGFSYYSALDPESGFIKSFVGFTCGVGLCEELVKLIPVIWLMKRAFKKGETLHLSEILLVGLASGVGFGVAEGIMYSAQFYNGIYGWEIYWVRFVTCVALHSTWTGIAVLILWTVRELLKEDEKKEKPHILMEAETVTEIFMLAIFSGVAIILHGLYDTLLKKGEDFWALVVAITTFVVFYYLLSEMYKKEIQI
jgi:tetratricopeptide (TPR) repeat protein/RsiW-degrading membrane proteinase PrsW (M82 family)